MNLILAFSVLLAIVAAAALAACWRRFGDSSAPACNAESDSKKLDRVVQDYQEILSDLARRLGLQGKTLVDAGKLVNVAEEGMSAELKLELSQRLSEIIATNNQLRQDLYESQQRIAAQHAELDRARAESRIDFLTQLPNRRGFEEKAVELHGAFERHGVEYALALFDIDHFKSFNDTHGHATGDAMLRTVAKAASGIRRTSDYLARIGGEEFALLFPHLGLSQCRFAAERYRQAIGATKLRVNNQQLNVAASFGIAVIQPGESFSALLMRADDALYAAKASGRNQVCIHDGLEAATPSSSSAVEV